MNRSTNNPIVTGSYCDSVTFNGKTYTISGTYVQEYKTVSGCDSSITYRLTINPSNTSNISETACGSFTFAGSTYIETGTYTIKLTNTHGCDSTVILRLDINNVDVTVTQTDSILTAAIADSYQWIDCKNNTPVAGATSQKYTVTETGTYAVVVTANDCTDTSECLFVEIEPVSLKEAAFGNNITLYPNPTGGEVTITTEQTLRNATIALVNVTGQVLQQHNAQHGKIFRIDMSAYAAGVYFVTLSEGGKTERMKVVKHN